MVHDRATLTLYGTYAVWGWLLYSFNPSVPLLADDQGISAALAGLHGTAMAAGGLVAAYLTPRVVLWWGRRTAVVAAGLTVAVCVVGLVAGPGLPWTLTAMFLLSIGGNVLVAANQVGLALRHGPTAPAAITEGNATGSGVGMLGPLAVGASVSLGWGWRPAVLVTAVLGVAVAVLVRRLPTGPSLTGRPGRTVVPDEPAVPTQHETWRPGPAVAIFLAGVVAAVAVENATTYWSTALLIERTGAEAGIATAATAGLVAGMTAMRLVVGPLSLRIDPAHLLAGGFLLSIAGVAVTWTTQTTGVAVAGLVLTGLGIGVQYPLTIALLFAAAPGHSDRVQGQATLFGSLSIGVAPFLLGAVSDRLGIHAAFVLVPVFALVGAVVAVVGGHALRKAALPVSA